MDRYAVLGHPVGHSKSPAIHARFARQTGQELEYSAIDVPVESFSATVDDFFAAGGNGLNVTVPFKQEAWALAEKHSDDALHAGAVNTLLKDAKGTLLGYNTDGIGLVRDILQNNGGVLADKDILLVGAGGAARGILLPLLREGPRSLCIVNRTEKRASELADAFSQFNVLDACGFEALSGRSFDWVINATAASLQDELPPLPDASLNPGAWCYDLMYAQEPTVFCRWAQSNGAARALDGLGMLVEQAAEAFYLWRGVRPLTGAVITALRN